MVTTIPEQAIQLLEVLRDERIAAPMEIVFETILEQMGPLNETPDGTPLNMTLEPWPGGRWFRDFGNNTGHFWGHVQSFKPPTLLEIHGPLFMSSPAVSHIYYRLSQDGSGTRLQFSHRAIGDIPQEMRDGVAVNKGWSNFLGRLRAAAEAKGRSSSK